MKNLRPNERCPIHYSFTCCGRTPIVEHGLHFAAKYREIQPGVRVYPDGHIERSPAALKRRKDTLLRQGQVCRACQQPFDDYTEVELAHDQSKGFQGWKRNDSDENTFLLHQSTNREQGSLSWDVYVRTKEKKKFPCQKKF